MMITIKMLMMIRQKQHFRQCILENLWLVRNPRSWHLLMYGCIVTVLVTILSAYNASVMFLWHSYQPAMSGYNVISL